MIFELFMECYSILEECEMSVNEYFREIFCPSKKVRYNITDPKSFELIEREPSPVQNLYDSQCSSSSDYDDFVPIRLP